MAGDEGKPKYHLPIGYLLWAKIGRHPYWPCMISYDPMNGLFFKDVKGRNGDIETYHVQYFGKSRTHGWTTGAIFPFQGKGKYFAKRDKEINGAQTDKQKKKLKMKYDVPSKVMKEWLHSVSEAECALKYRVEDRHELYVFKYDINFKQNERDLKRRRRRRHKWITKAQRNPIYTIPSKIAEPLCDLCEKGSVDLSCSSGICKRSFHKSCVGIVNAPDNFVCSFCAVNGDQPCIVCKCIGNAKKCTKCDKFFHHYCMSRFKTSDVKKGICGAHACWTCFLKNPRNGCTKGPFVTCFRCPTAFHDSLDCIPVGSVRLSPEHILCPEHFLGKNRVSPQPNINMNSCIVCSEVGELVCCEACPNAYHKKCLNGEVPLGDFYCDDCAARKYIYTGMIVWAKTGCHRWWPAVVFNPDDVPPKVNGIVKYDGEFPVVFFGTDEFSWTHRGKVFPYNNTNRFVITKASKARLDAMFKISLDDASVAYDAIQQGFSNNSYRSTYHHIRVNRAIPPAVIKSVPQSSCLCSPSNDNPCGPNSRCLNRLMLYECHPDQCPAKDKCQNQSFQKRNYAKVKIIRTTSCGFGLAARELIKEGSFIIEYVGEVITTAEYRKRAHQMRINNSKNYYFLYLDKDRIIDAGPSGNYSRFINHSCNPNCVMEKWSVNGDLRIGIFALTDIKAGTELTFNYQSDVEHGQECHCGAKNCLGIIGRNANKKRKVK